MSVNQIRLCSLSGNAGWAAGKAFGL